MAKIDVSIRGLVSDSFLREFAKNVAAETKACADAFPLWESCFEKGYDSSMANKILSGKSPSVVRAHNALHASCQKLNKAAVALSIRPLVNHHPLCSTEIVVALSALAKAKTVSVVCLGVTNNFYFHYRTDFQLTGPHVLTQGYIVGAAVYIALFKKV